MARQTGMGLQNRSIGFSGEKILVSTQGGIIPEKVSVEKRLPFPEALALEQLADGDHFKVGTAKEVDGVNLFHVVQMAGSGGNQG